MRLLLVTALLAGFGCRKKTEEAPPAFSDALVRLLVEFEEPVDVVAENIRAVERQVYLGMDVEAKNPLDRALAPDFLTDSDVESLNGPKRPAKDALPISVAGVSNHPVSAQSSLQVEVDHRPWEPYSPNHFERSFMDGRDCWLDQGCEWLVTDNELTKENLLMTVPYTFFKDFRWIDLADDGGDPRWAIVARSWTPKSFAGDSDKAFIHQSYTIEIWVPRDGRGYIRSGKDKNVDDGEWTTDSNGGGTLRLLTLWSETEFVGLNVGDDAVIATTRTGIDKNFEAADEYLDENGG